MYCSNYNPNIDATGVIVTVSLVDFNNNVVPNKRVTLSVDRGIISSVDVGSNATISSNGKSVSVNANSSGVVKVKYTASEWGMCTFTANGNNLQVYVRGWKLIFSDTTNGVYIRSNGILAEIYWSRSAQSIPKGTSTILTVPSDCCPFKVVGMWGHTNSNKVEVTLNTSGMFEVHNFESKAINLGLNGSHLYRLATPLY